MGAYSKILKQAYEITRQYNFLWIFGLFLSIYLLYSISEVQLVKSLNIHPLVALGVWLALVIFFARSHTALIIAINAILEKKETSIKKAFNASKSFVSRVLVISVSVYFVLIVAGGILLGPAMYLYDKNLATQAGVLLGLGLLIYLPIIATGIMVGVLSPMYIVLYDLKIKEALERSWALIGKHWYAVFGLLISLIILDLPALFLAQFMVGLHGGLVVYIALGIIFLVFQSVFMVFQQIAWILLFNDLIKPQKIETEQPVVAPEIAS